MRDYYAFIKIISSENVSSEFVLLSDNDGEGAEARAKSLKEEISKQFSVPPDDLDKILEGKIHVLNEYSVESYLLNEETLIKAFPEIDKASIKTFLTEYKAKYAEQLCLVGEGKLKLDIFGRYMKPKAIFEAYPNENAEEAYRKAWDGNDTFLKVRGLIAEACKQIGISNGDYFEHLLELSNIETIPELSDKKKLILTLLD